MDRDDLMSLLAELDGYTLKVDVEGLIYDGDDTPYTPADVADAIEELHNDLNRLREVVAWAKRAPLYQGGDKPADTGETCDANDVPY